MALRRGWTKKSSTAVAVPTTKTAMAVPRGETDTRSARRPTTITTSAVMRMSGPKTELTTSSTAWCPLRMSSEELRVRWKE